MKVKATTVYLDGIPLKVGVLTTSPEKTIGYQHQEVEPKPGHGLLFDFSTDGEDGVHSFHMKNVSFPLELLAFDSAGLFLGSTLMYPQEKGTPTKHHRTPSGTMFAIEVNPTDGFGIWLEPGVSVLTGFPS